MSDVDGFNDDRDEDFNNDFTVGPGGPNPGYSSAYADEEEPADYDEDEDDEHQDYDEEYADQQPTVTDESGYAQVEDNLELEDQRLGSMGAEYDPQEATMGEDHEPPEIESIFPAEEDVNGLQVSKDLKDMFRTIFQFTPQTLEISTPVKPFIPRYEPSIGDTDTFTKVTRPDGQVDSLGLTSIDEPGPIQSNPSILEMRLKSQTSLSHQKKKKKDVAVRTVDPNEKGALGLQSWIQSIEEMHRSRPSPSVSYKGPMPSIETLMQVWPQTFEQALRQHPIPPLAEMDMPLKDYLSIVLSLLDIPVYEGSYKDSLHILFTLFSEFRQNPHFKLRSAAEMFAVSGSSDSAEGGGAAAAAPSPPTSSSGSRSVSFGRR